MTNRLRIAKYLFFCLVLTITVNEFAYGNDFSCSYGKRGACLDYGDKVCSSLAKCVSSDAVCFDSYTCNYNGFICKSKFDDLADEYSDLAGKCQEVASEYDDLLNQYNRLLRRHRSLNDCIGYASSLDEAQDCAQ